MRSVYELDRAVRFLVKPVFFLLHVSIPAISTSCSDSLAKLLGLFLSSPSAAPSPHFPPQKSTQICATWPPRPDLRADRGQAGEEEPRKSRRCQVCGGNESADLWVTPRQQTGVLLTSSISPSRNKSRRRYFTPHLPTQPFHQQNLSCSWGQNKDPPVHLWIPGGVALRTAAMEGDRGVHGPAVKEVKCGPNPLGYSRLPYVFRWTEPDIFMLTIRDQETVQTFWQQNSRSKQT